MANLAVAELSALPYRGPEEGNWLTGSGPVSRDALVFSFFANGLMMAVVGASLALAGGVLSTSPMAGACLRAGCAMLSISAACLAASSAAGYTQPRT